MLCEFQPNQNKHDKNESNHDLVSVTHIESHNHGRHWLSAVIPSAPDRGSLNIELETIFWFGQHCHTRITSLLSKTDNKGPLQAELLGLPFSMEFSEETWKQIWICLQFLLLVNISKCRMHQQFFQQLCTSKCICERKVALRCGVCHIPHELKRELLVGVLVFIKSPSPSNLLKESIPIPFPIVPYLPLYTVPKLVVAVSPPKWIYDLQVCLWDKLNLSEINPFPLCCPIPR